MTDKGNCLEALRNEMNELRQAFDDLESEYNEQMKSLKQATHSQRQKHRKFLERQQADVKKFSHQHKQSLRQCDNKLGAILNFLKRELPAGDSQRPSSHRDSDADNSDADSDRDSDSNMIVNRQGRDAGSDRNFVVHNQAASSRSEMGAGAHSRDRDEVRELDRKHRPRLCHITLPADSRDYGFRLTSKEDSRGLYVSGVTNNSPAQAANLKVKDKLVEVNGTNVEQMVHKDVAQLIRSNPREVTLLVLDPDSCWYYEQRGITVNSDLPQVQWWNFDNRVNTRD